MECYTCRSISGEKRISPGPFIYEGTHWLVDHAYPVLHTGWLVLVTRRHVEALHELSREEFAELATIQYALAQVMSQFEQTQKEYMMCFAEAEHFAHIHIHFVRKPEDLPAEQRGPRIFAWIAVDEEHAVPADEIITFSEDFKRRLQAVL